MLYCVAQKSVPSKVKRPPNPRAPLQQKAFLEPTGLKIGVPLALPQLPEEQEWMDFMMGPQGWLLTQRGSGVGLVLV